MRELAPGLFQLRGFPPNNYNVYLLKPALVCFGHGPALRDGGKFTSFVEEKMTR